MAVLVDKQWEVMDMQKYIDNLDDFEDDNRPPIVDMVEWLVPRIIAAVGIMLVLMLCASLEAL